jgi:hypothetical protein
MLVLEEAVELLEHKISLMQTLIILALAHLEMGLSVEI